VKGKITINGGDATDPDAIVVAGNVIMKGDVDVALTAEGEAISGTLQMTGAAKTLKLVQGYINTIRVDVQNAGDWEDKYINVVLNSANEGLAAFATLAEAIGIDGKASIAKFTESVWDGKQIKNATYKNLYTSAYGSTKTIFTASQLARVDDTTGPSALCNNIDLNNKPWKAVKKSGNFSGWKVVDVADSDEYPTIKNLKLSKDDNSMSAAGLFTEINGAATIKDITIDGVSGIFSKADAKNVGAIAGKASAAVTFENVEVKGLAISSEKKLEKVGGFIGEATATFQATDATIAGSIDGYSSLGGFIGVTNKAATFKGCDASAITFKQTYNSPKTMDIAYAKIGGFIGAVTTSVAVTITDGVAPASINYDKAAKQYVSDTSAGTGNFYTYEARQNFIGFSGNANNTIATKIGNSKINGTNYCADAAFGTSKANGDNGHTHAGPVAFTYLFTWPAK
jgi:hypothetical protein